MTDATGDLATNGSIRRLVIVDSDHRVRSGLNGLLELSDELAIVAAVGTADEAVAAAAGLQPDAILLDPRLPDAEVGLALLPRLRRAAPAALILVLAWTADVAEEAFAAGADAIVDKCADPTPFTEAVLAAVATPSGAPLGRSAALGGSAALGRSGAESPIDRPGAALDSAPATTARPSRQAVPRPAHP
jgi:CheY-like chemotaxis protein